MELVFNHDVSFWERRTFELKARIASLERTMNIFYVIGVVVVIVVVAGFLGVHL